MKKSMLLTATAIVLVGIIFCGCGEHTNAGNTPEQVHDVAQSTVFSSAVNESTEAVPTVTQQTSTVPTASSENTESLGNDSTPYDYSENEPILSTEAISENTEPTTEPPTEPPTEPLYVSDYVYSDIELEVFELINRERANAGVEPLTLSYVYADCAYVRALEADVLWSHTRPNGCECITVLNEYNLQDSYLRIGNLRILPTGTVTVPDCQTANGGRHPDSGRQEGLGQGGGSLHSDQRKVQGRCPFAEGLHHGLSYKKEEKE